MADPASLVASVSALLESFDRAHAGAEVRLWACDHAGCRRVFPAEAEASPLATFDPNSETWPVHPEDPHRLVVETTHGRVGQHAIDFLLESLRQVYRYEREARSAAQELGERYEEIDLLYSISEVLGSVLSLSAAANRILSDVAEVLGARRAALWVEEPEEHLLNLAAAVGEDGLDGPISVDDPRSVTARVFRERQPLNVERGHALPADTDSEPLRHGPEAFLSVPINFTPRNGDPRTVGVITLVGRTTGVRFTAGDARLLSAVASQVGAALETHRLMAESVSRERLERELELAHHLQLKLLPETGPFEAITPLAARCAPADSVGGDFYYLFRLTEGRLGVMIGDVSGHGFSAALIMAMTISAAAIYVQEARPPADVLRQIHRALIDELETTEHYLSLFYGVVDPVRRRIEYANAGHHLAFRITANGEPVRLGATDPPLGTVPIDDYSEALVCWDENEEGGLLCLFTDGLSDAFAGADGAAGEANLLREVIRRRAHPPAEILEHLFRRAGRSTLFVPPDDRTAVLVRL